MSETVDTQAITDPTAGRPEDADTLNPGDVSEGTKRRKRRSDAGKPRGPRRSSRGVSAIAKKLSSGINLVAAVVSAVDVADGAIIGANADKLAQAWAPVINENQRALQILGQLEKGGHLGGAVLATGAVVLPILVRHRPDVFPPMVRAFALSLVPEEVRPIVVDTTATSETFEGTAVA